MILSLGLSPDGALRLTGPSPRRFFNAGAVGAVGAGEPQRDQRRQAVVKVKIIP